MNERDPAYLQHILDSIDRIRRYTRDVDEDRFVRGEMRQDAVIRQISIIGEAVAKLSPEVEQRRPAIPWRDIAGMRHKLVHDYFGVDLEAVWDTAQDDLDPLRRAVENLLEEIRNENE